ncbi:F-type H+-transporting ATPase subunit delta [Anaerotaenia torta]|uniref:ATP synthase F1 subunit delta n=1 Tax=Anaerotaenia torta TaxID=433293 RepID=UPI003D217755
MAELKDRYAASLFEMALETGELKSYFSQVSLLRDILEKEHLTELLENPHIPDATKRELLEKHFGGEISGDLMGFLRLMVEKGRESIILPTLDTFLELGNQHRGKTIAYVVSAVALRPEQVDALSGLLSKKLGKKAEILTREDPALIGGFYIHVDGRLIDRTVRTGLRNLKETLQRGEPNDNKT